MARRNPSDRSSVGREIQYLDPTLTGRAAESLDLSLRSKIVGQEEAVAQIVNIYQTFQAGLSPQGRPVGNFLFLGPTGTGKTRLVEAAAESLMGDARAVIKIDCAEFQHSHEIAKLIGSPPGYLGHRETHPLLSQEVLNQYHTDRVKLSFVLFDEIEKASDALWCLLLGILDKATLTLGDNRRVDFSRAMIFLTSNLGAQQMEGILRPRFGFGNAGPIDSAETSDAKIARAGIEAARRKFTPEFINRIDKTVVFRPLTPDHLRQILAIELSQIQARVFQAANATPFLFQLTDPAKERLLIEGTDATYGARHLKRAIERSLVHPLSNLVASDQVRMGDVICVDWDESARQMTFRRESEPMAPQTLAQWATKVAPAAARAVAAEAPHPIAARRRF